MLFAVTIAARADRGGFYYQNFRVDAVVHRDNVWDITETIDVFFEEPPGLRIGSGPQTAIFLFHSLCNMMCLGMKAMSHR